MPRPSDGNDANGPEPDTQDKAGKEVEASNPSAPPSSTSSSAPGSSEGGSRGWIDSLARRSTGLPQQEVRPDSELRKGDTSLWRLAGLGIQFAATVAIFAFMGNALDKKMGWSPWALVSFSLLAVIGNLYLLIKETLKQDSTTKKTTATTTTTKLGAKDDRPQPGKRSPP